MVAPPDASKPTAGAVQTPNVAARAGQSTPQGASAAPVAADRADIRPLELAGALQILLSEVRAELDALLLDAGGPAPAQAERTDTPPAAVRALLDALLKALPESPADFSVLNQALMRAESAWQIGTARALGVIGAWKDVPGPVVESAREVVASTGALLDAEAMNPAWLGAGGSGIAWRLERHRRRRSRLRRWLTDPDFRPAQVDEDEEDRSGTGPPVRQPPPR